MNDGNLKTNLEALQNKARERTVKTQNIEYDLETLIKRIDKGIIKLDPDYQRRHRWPDEVSSRLIESLLLNIPIPVIYISQDVDVDEENDDGAARFTVIDGQQRLTAIYKFMKGTMALEGLDILREANGLKIKELPPFLTRRLDERTIKCLRIDSTLDPQVKYDIFERLNTGSVKLESQELRNATHRGPFNDAIKEMAKGHSFRKLIQVPLDDPESSVKVQKMEDVELVLRFFALKDNQYKEMRKGFREFLSTRLTDLNDSTPIEIEKFKFEFRLYTEFVLNNMGEYAFAKYRTQNGAIQKKMSSFNAAVFDAVLVGISQVYSPEDILENPERCASNLYGYERIFDDENFFMAVSGSTNDASKIKYRIDRMAGFLSR